MIGYMRHGAPPRLMAPQSIRSADLRESNRLPHPETVMSQLTAAQSLMASIAGPKVSLQCPA